MATLFQRLLRDTRGLSAVEYGLVATLLSLLVIGGATLSGIELNSMFNDIAASIGGAN